jgi:inner membrane protein
MLPGFDVSIAIKQDKILMNLLSKSLRSSPGFKIFFIGFLVIILLIPMSMIEGLIYERSHLYRQANSEITRVWGAGHTLSGPILTIPQLGTNNNKPGWIQSITYRNLAAESLNISGNFHIQLRYRGIYKVPVYLGQLSLKGKFVLPEETNVELVDKILLQFPFTQIKTLKKSPKLIWNGVPMPLIAIGDENNKDAVIFQAPIAPDEIAKGEFEIIYQAAGSDAFSVQSLAKNTKLLIKSNWGSPSFQGDFLPTTHDIQKDGFTAIWDINNIFMKSKNSTEERVSLDWFSEHDLFGVKFIQPADTYQLVTRSAKYAVLFISLTFMIYFLLELLGGIKLHAVQYLFIGLANCIFYLLLLSLAEHIKFNIAYFLSASASSLLISLYSKSVLKNILKAFVVFVVLGALYIYLFVTLQSEGFALITGSLGLFVIMATLMYITRNTNWHSLNTSTDN